LNTLMYDEALSSAQQVRRQLASDGERYAELGTALRAHPPQGCVTIARGSSDHAAGYCAYLIMSRLGHLVTSLPMSLLTQYAAPLKAKNLFAIAISQSGRSPDLVEPMLGLQQGGATTVALVNDANSPLARAVGWTLPLHAGPEHSVAATKSFICSLVAGARLTACWGDDIEFAACLDALPDALEQACLQDWSAAVEPLKSGQKLMVIGRGPGLAIANEAALKFKETCGIQAEAFSGAEVKHGPMALVDAAYPMLIFAPRGPVQAGLIDLADEMRGRGAHVLLAAPSDVPSRDLTLALSPHRDLDPITAIQSFYLLVEAVARARGLDPDRPRHLSKVTSTR
jgi:glucosamine--fructose-6-phosphate aminotransferase (isomerizing)